LDAIKYVPLGANGDAYLSVGGELRTFYQSFANESFGQISGADNYILQRYLLHFNVHPSARSRVFVDLESALIGGRRGGPRPTVDRDDADVHAAFFDLDLGPRNLAKPSVDFRIDRQEFDYGSGRLVSTRESPNGDGPNVLQAFDALRVILRHTSWRIDAFDGRPVVLNVGPFDNGTDSKQAIWGIYATSGLPGSPKPEVDLYYTGLDRDKATFDKGSARERRHSLGVRAFRTRTALDYDLEATYQFGSFGSAPLHAYSVATDTGYTFEKAAVQPRIGILTGFASGDRDRLSNALTTFYSPFPRGVYFGELPALGPSNVFGFKPNLTVAPTKSVTLSSGAFFFWRQRLGDGIYALSGLPIRTGAKSSARYIGTQPELVASWTVDRHVFVNASYSRFLSGHFCTKRLPDPTSAILRRG